MCFCLTPLYFFTKVNKEKFKMLDAYNWVIAHFNVFINVQLNKNKGNDMVIYDIYNNFLKWCGYLRSDQTINNCVWPYADMIRLDHLIFYCCKLETNISHKQALVINRCRLLPIIETLTERVNNFHILDNTLFPGTTPSWKISWSSTATQQVNPMW